MRACTRTSPTDQRGALALTMVLVVAVALTLVAAYAFRVAWLELKASGSRMRAVQAAEAAESGLAWALARLNDERPIDSACRPAAAGTSFRERYLGGPSTPSCAFDGEAWACSCPASGTAVATATMTSATDAARQAFALQLSLAASGVTTVGSIGCSGALAGCLAPVGQAVPVQTHIARAWTDVARIPAIDARPVATITARGTMQLLDGPTVVHHAIASGGLTLHAGAGIDPGDALLAGPPGAPPRSTLVGGDTVLGSLDAARFFASVFRMDKAAWRTQPAAQVMDCTTPCDDALVERLAPTGAPSLVWLDGGLRLDGAAELGSPARPVLLVVDGAVHLRGPVRIHGVLYLRSADWRDEAGADIRGALLAENDLRLAGPTRIEHDAGIVERLQRCCGTYARLPGSWRDI